MPQEAAPEESAAGGTPSVLEGPGPGDRGPGDDTVRGQDGRDLFYDDGPGEDRVSARGGVRDLVDCGAGTDTVVTFDKGVDVVVNCEEKPPSE